MNKHEKLLETLDKMEAARKVSPIVPELGKTYRVLQELKEISPINYRELLNSETYPIGAIMVCVHTSKYKVNGMRLLIDGAEIFPYFGKPWNDMVLWQDYWFNSEFLEVVE